MDAADLFDIWAPSNSIWAQWAKPVVFTVTLSNPARGALGRLPDLFAWRSGLGTTAIIVNLPGVDSIAYGLALAEQGFRPVPLFNSVNGPSAVYDVTGIKAALTTGAETLRTLRIGPEAPPAFLIDADRLKGNLRPGRFDNRWVVFPQDFPSGIYLQAHGIKRAILVQRERNIERDLAQVLGLWKRTGLEVLMTPQGSAAPQAPERLKEIRRFDLARAAFVAGLIASLSLHRNNAGGFGAILPVPERGG